MITFAYRVEQVDGWECWRYIGCHRRQDGRPVHAHRYVYRLTFEEERGPIPTGLVLDHLCRHPWCIRPDHLDPVPQITNMQRAGVRGGDINVGQALKTHCPAGHAYSPDNTYHWRGERHCRACRVQAKRRYRARAGRF